MYVIAEIGSNWIGNLDSALEIIDACKEAGADAVKFQMWDADMLYDGKNKEFQMDEYDMYMIMNHCKNQKIICFATPSYPEAVDILEDLHVPMYKIASITSAQKHPKAEETMKKVAKTGKPVIISTGFGDKTGDIFKNSYTRNLRCVPEYPAQMQDYLKMREKVEGISDHTIGTNLMYYTLFTERDHNKPMILEKHVKIEDNESPDSPFSLHTDELADFITLSKSPFVNLG